MDSSFKYCFVITYRNVQTFLCLISNTPRGAKRGGLFFEEGEKLYIATIPSESCSILRNPPPKKKNIIPSPEKRIYSPPNKKVLYSLSDKKEIPSVMKGSGCYYILGDIIGSCTVLSCGVLWIPLPLFRGEVYTSEVITYE